MCCLLIIEVVVRTFNADEHKRASAWLESKPSAFRNEPNFASILKTLDGTCKWPPLIHRDGVSFYNDNFSCGDITYFSGKRVTLPIVSEWKKTIHVLGGSTVFGTGSTDSLTIPSIIQKTLLSDRVRVLNYGVSSYVTKQQNNTLTAFKNDIKQGDVVIYYDGGNDFWNGVMLGNFGGSMVGYNQNHKYQLNLFLVRSWLSQNSETYQLLSDLKHGRKKTKKGVCSVQPQIAMKRVDKAAIHYSNEINRARMISEKLGAKFFHFYQPTLFDSVSLTNYETEVLSKNPCWYLAQSLKEKFDKHFLDMSEYSIDLSDILVGKDLFFDYIHVSSEANQLVVEAIVKGISD
jgi:lysophospholipase L1-like esterase